MRDGRHECRDLEYMIAAYFHQDWDIEGASSDEVVDLFARENGRKRCIAVAADIDHVLGSGRSEDEIRMLLAEAMASGYDPYLEEVSMRYWLASIRRRLKPFIE